MRQHVDRDPGPYQRHFRRREQTSGLRLRGLDQPAAHVLRRADIRPRLLHGSKRGRSSQVRKYQIICYLAKHYRLLWK